MEADTTIQLPKLDLTHRVRQCQFCEWWVKQNAEIGFCHGEVPKPVTPFIPLPAEQAMVNLTFKSGPVVWPATMKNAFCPKWQSKINTGEN